VYLNNHTAVWGSWFNKSTAEWGYACCHSTLHISYCAGLAAIEASEASSARHLLQTNVPDDDKPSSSKEEESTKKEKIEQNFSAKRVGEGDVVLDKEKLERALKEEKKRKAKAYDDDEERHGRKKSKGVIESSSHDVTEEQMGRFLSLFRHF